MFEAQLDDVIFYVKRISLLDLESTLEEIEIQLHKIGRALVGEIADAYLRENHSGCVNIGPEVVYDANMNVIEPIQNLKDTGRSIENVIVGNAMATFQEGRALSIRIAARYREYSQRNSITASPPSVSRDYRQNPPAEAYEIEMMRLERKLPNLTAEEGRYLSELYSRIDQKV